MTLETIKFELEFIPDYWGMPPRASISIDDTRKFNGDITKEECIISFDHTLEFGNSHTLCIDKYGKGHKQVRVNPDGTVSDQTLTIKNIIIDGINIRNWLYTHSYYTPMYLEPWASEQKAAGIILEKTVPGETHLSHDGIWTFNFSSPFYQFVFDAMDGEI